MTADIVPNHHIKQRKTSEIPVMWLLHIVHTLFLYMYYNKGPNYVIKLKFLLG